MAQGWKKIFNRINWMNRPNTTTPLNATNLNAGDSAIDELDDRILALDTIKADMSVVNGMVADVLLNDKTGVITVTYKNGSRVDYNTNLEKIAVNFSYDYENQRLVLTLPDGTTQYVDLSALITQYEFKDSSTIVFSVDKEGKISASIKNGSITDSMLESGYLSKLTSQAAKAENASNSALTSSNSAYDNAKLSQSYAIGGSGTRDGEDTDNAKYYSEQASASASSASESASGAESAKQSASASATSASNSAASASTSATNAKVSETASATSATNAKKSETNATSSADTARKNAASATSSANSASASATDAESSANSALESEKNASSSASSASTSAKNASTSETNAKKSETNAASSASSASTSASSASASATSASNSKDSASASATSASASATTASSKASAASTSASNASASEANAKKYYEQAKAISESFSGALRPMGTVAFANLPSVSSASAGDMYNISDEFVTTSDFVEGAGHTEPAGSNVYKTEAGKWDVLAGSPVTGVKGANETSFRRGNVNITCDDVGALATNGDSKSCTTTFTSNDSATGDSTPPALLTSGETHSSFFSKVSTIFKNVRWLLSKMGTTDISAIGNGTVTGALSTLNSNMTYGVTDAGWGFSYMRNSLIINSKIASMCIHIVRADGAIPQHDYSLFSLPNDIRPVTKQLVSCNLISPSYQDKSVTYVEINTDGAVNVAEGFNTSAYNRAIIWGCFIVA